MSDADRKHAAEIAARLDGVAYVDNDIEISSDVEDRVEPLTGILSKRLNAFVKRLPLIAFAFALFIPFAFLARLLGRWNAPFRWVTGSELVRGIVQRIVATAVFLGGIVVALEVLDATALVGAVLGAAGVVGIAVGFAFRDIAENYLSSILLGMRRPFSVHDHVRIEVRGQGRATDHPRDHLDDARRQPFENSQRDGVQGGDPQLHAQSAAAVRVRRRGGGERRLESGAAAGDRDPRGHARHARRPYAALPGRRARGIERGHSVLRVDRSAQDRYLQGAEEAIRRVKVALDDAGIDMPEPTFRIRRVPSKPTHAAAPHPVDTDADEVEVDDHLGRQIERDLAEDDQGNLLRGP